MESHGQANGQFNGIWREGMEGWWLLKWSRFWLVLLMVAP